MKKMLMVSGVVGGFATQAFADKRPAMAKVLGHLEMSSTTPPPTRADTA